MVDRKRGWGLSALLLWSSICHRQRKGIRKEMKRFGAFIVLGVLAWILADTQMNHGSSSVHVHWFSHWKIRADNNDVLI